MTKNDPKINGSRIKQNGELSELSENNNIKTQG